jgi:hypothetical protein
MYFSTLFSSSRFRDDGMEYVDTILDIKLLKQILTALLGGRLSN